MAGEFPIQVPQLKGKLKVGPVEINFSKGEDNENELQELRRQNEELKKQVDGLLDEVKKLKGG